MYKGFIHVIHGRKSKVTNKHMMEATSFTIEETQVKPSVMYNSSLNGEKYVCGDSPG